MNIIERFNSLAAFGQAWILWALAALSVLGLAIIAERSICYVTTRDDSARLRRDILSHAGAGDLLGLEQRLSESPSYEARIVAASLAGDPAGLAERLAAEHTRARVDMERYLAFLGTVGSNAPFVGLLGTVIGIIGAFRQLDASGGQLSEGLMTQVGEALVATAVGIFVALPAIAAFNGFQRVIQTRLARGEALGQDLAAVLKEKTSRS